MPIRYKPLWFTAILIVMNAVHLTVAETTPLVVVELFTSQGCSSCPRADKFLGELSEDASVITISCHVTYWNYLGWQDSFSLPYCDSRQAFYRERFNNRSSYTPQMVINGSFEGVGSQQQKINQLIELAQTRTHPVNIDITLNGNQISIDARALNSQSATRFDVLGLGARQQVDISRGENEGRSITYTNPVLAYHQLDSENFAEGRTTIDIEANKQITSWVVLTNDLKTGAIVGAGSLVTTSNSPLARH